MNLTQRIMLLILITISLSTLSNFLLTQYQEEVLHNDSEKILAHTTVQSLRDTLAHDVIDGNKLRVTNLLRTLKEHSNPIEFLYVSQGVEKNIFAHSFDKGFPRFLVSNTIKQLHHAGIELTAKYQTQHGLVYEYSESLIPGLDTTLHIGINQTKIAETLAHNKETVLLISLAISLVALFIGYIWSKQITAPLNKFSDAIRRYGEGEVFDSYAINHATPEIKVLASAFQDAIEERHKIYAELEETAQDLTVTLDSIGDAVIATDAQGNVTRMNPVAEKLTGWAIGDARGESVKTVFPVINATTREAIENPIEKVLSAGEVVHLSDHTALIAKDGTEYQISDSAAPIRDKKKNILGMVLVFNDVTEHHRLRQERRNSEERFRQLTDNINEVFWLGTPQWDKVFYVSPAYEKIWGLNSEDLYRDSHTWLEAVHPDDREQLVNDIPKDVNSIGEYVDFEEYRIQKPDGQILWIKARAYPITDQDGQVIRVAGIAEDITGRKKIEKIMQESERRLAYAQHMAHIGSWDLDLLTSELTWSDEIYNIFEINKEKFGASYEAFLNTIHPEDREKVNTAYKASVINKIPYRLTHRLCMADGRIKYVNERCETFYDESGNPVRSSGTVQDITEQVGMEEAIRRTQKMDAVGQLAGGIAHDYNNMLGIILGYADLLKAKLVDQPKLKDFVDEIHHAGERGKQLTAALLSFSRQSISGAEVVNVNDLLNAMKNMLVRSLTARVTLIFDLEKDPWPVWLDISGLEDAIINLSINAMHAIDETGQLTVLTRNIFINKEDARQFQTESGNYLQLSFSDSGRGMDNAIKEKIFNPFFSTKGDKGTGLGLSQVYGFVQSCGGSIKVYSEVNHGTRIVLYFPQHRQEKNKGKSIEDDRAADYRGRENILVVDDEQALLNLTREVLESQGYHVFCAEHAKQALEILENNSIDLLFSDVVMPEMDGYQLAEIVSEKYPSIKIQLASGFSDDHRINEKNEYLETNLIHKPYPLSDLLKRIRELLDGS